VQIDDKTWTDLVAAAASVGVDEQKITAIASS
jgi:hypothetical protein